MKTSKLACIGVATLTLFCGNAVAQNSGAKKQGAVSVSVTASGVETEGCTLTVLSQSGKYAAGDVIVVSASLKNQGKDNVQIVRIGDLGDYAFIVTGPDGKPASLTEYGKLETSAKDFISRFTDIVEPGASATVGFHLNRIFDMTRVGKYTVSISRSVHSTKSMAQTIVSSGTLPITVADEKKEVAAQFSLLLNHYQKTEPIP